MILNRKGHPRDSALLELATNGDLDSRTRRHVDACPVCRAEVDGLARVLVALESLPRTGPSPDLAQRTYEAVERFELEWAAREPGLERFWFRVRDFFGSLSGPVPAAALAAVLLFVGIRPGGVPEPAALPGPLVPNALILPIPRPRHETGARKDFMASASTAQVPASVREADPSRLVGNPVPGAEPRMAEVAAVGVDKPAGSGSSVNPLFAGGSGSSAPSRAASSRAAMAGGESGLGSLGVEVKVLGNLVRVETGDKARVLVKVRTALQASVEVFGAAGDKAATLFDGVLEPGQREFLWDGKTAGGNPVASGVYVLAIHGDGFSETVKLVVLR